MAAGSIDIAVRFLADASSIKSAASEVDGTGSKIKNWAKGIGVAIGTAFAIDQVKEWIGAASELQDQVSASQQIFGDASKSVTDFGGKAADAFGISKSDAIGAANTFATFGKSAGLTGDNLAGFSTNLTGLAGDLASFRGTSPEQAIEAIGAALRGETEPIRAYGVLLDDATLRQRAMALGLTDTTKNALTPQQKVLAAQAEILAQTGDAQGDFQRTGDSAANQQKKLSAQIENTQAALGTALLPVLSAILPVLQTFARFVQENAGWLVPLVAIVGAFAAAIWLVNIAMNANPIMLVVIALAALTAAFIWAYQNVDWFRAIVDTMAAGVTAAFDWVKETVQTVFGWISDHWPLLLAILTGPFGIAVGLIVSNWDSIKGGISAAIDWITNAMSTVGDIIVAPFQWAADRIADVVGGIKSGFSTAVDAIKSVWNSTAGGFGFEVPGWVPGIGGKGWEIPEMAAGGIVTRPMLALLGERGPEAVVPLGRGGAGQGNTTLIVNVTTTGLGTDAPQLQRAVADTLRKYVRKNGPIAGIAS